MSTSAYVLYTAVSLCHNTVCISSQAVSNVIKALVPVLATLFGLISYRVVRTAYN